MSQGIGQNLSLRYYSTVTAQKVEWLWFPYIPYGKITVIQGDPGDGKTTFALSIASLLSIGGLMPDTLGPISREKILYQSAEDGAEDTLKPRLVSAGADCTQVAFIDDSENQLTLDSPRLESAIVEAGARMLVLDPLQAYLGESGEINRAEGIRPMLKKLAAIAERTKCAIVMIGHMNKAVGTKGLYRGLGSIDIAAAARSIFLIGRIRDNHSIRVMAHLKSSLAEEGPSIAFEIDGHSGIRWIGEYDVTADELLNGSFTPDEGSKINMAEGIISKLLVAGSKPCTRLYEACAREKIGKRTVDIAKKNLGVRSQKRADGWYWSLMGVDS